MISATTLNFLHIQQYYTDFLQEADMTLSIVYVVFTSLLRVNASSLSLFRLKDISKLMSFIEEHAAIVDKENY